ncbi:MAG: nucleoside 2-deoxyribosyltransferase [Acuticoccus sp.]
MTGRVYLAGPEVFLPDADALFTRKKAICAAAGLVGVSPFDNEVGAMEGRLPMALAIYQGNIGAMESCEAAIANITPFRGVSLDAGTAFEVGYMCALGRPVVAYSADATGYAERTRAAAADNPLVAAEASLNVEEFGLIENLMIACGIEESGGRCFLPERPLDDRWRDLSLFGQCVKATAALLR